MIDFLNKKVAIAGFGIEGQSLYNYLKAFKASVWILDQNTELNVPDSAQAILGGHYLDHLEQFDVILRSPGVHPKLLQKAKLITSLTQLFFDHCPCPIIGVTGTKGKGTTATLISLMLEKSGQKVFLGGNIGKPPLDFIGQLTKNDIVVLELSSFQLINLDKSPQYAVVLMIVPEHLNYHQSVAEYSNAKSRIVLYQKSDDYAILNQDSEISRNFAKQTKAKVSFFSQKEKTNGSFIRDKNIYIIKDDPPLDKVSNRQDHEELLCAVADVALIGRHNLDNIMAASFMAYRAGASLDSIRAVIKTFKGLENRLEFVREINGISFYNDSFSTTPETAIAAIDSFSNPKILILGGASKESDYRDLAKKIGISDIRAVILIGETALEIEQNINKFSKKIPLIIKDLFKMRNIVKTCHKTALKGDVVLLSPGCASFGLFKNYKDRGEQFKNEVLWLS